ncbi:AbrB/MazE/SpoVT family DNA-binding domain-containing protein [Candidatus Bathyarchaeota archaeon]|nr:AbrB/MazE/SpoVT family DNA-binding domain-containing protein [Candidatus Bathyarchaeota archaeon]
MSDILVERKNVGSKGEILPSKRLREKVGLKAGDPIEIKAKGGTLIVKPAPDPLQELNGILDIDLTIKDLKKIAERQVVKEAAEKILKTHASS